jgi:hypothetical protein
MKQKIITQLHAIEKEHGVRILFACESGSRAWGFPSKDSDYDVRFIYVHPRDWYLSIDEKRDVIELPIDDILDISGWDLRKSLRLMRKSNSPLLEWISSPVLYHVWSPGMECLQKLARRSFLPETSCHHYLSLAKKSIEKIERSKNGVVKTYMYAIRSVLCCDWIVKNLTQPPIRLNDLLDGIKGESDFKEMLLDLVEQKKNETEAFSIIRSKTLESFLNRTMLEVEVIIPKNDKKLDPDVFDEEFRLLLSHVSEQAAF